MVIQSAAAAAGIIEQQQLSVVWGDDPLKHEDVWFIDILVYESSDGVVGPGLHSDGV